MGEREAERDVEAARGGKGEKRREQRMVAGRWTGNRSSDRRAGKEVGR